MKRVVIVGAGPAGLMAAEALLGLRCRVDVFDSMPSAGRKFLLAGRGGLNLTHSEPAELFLSRYGDRRADLEPAIGRLNAQALRDWALALGVDTFVGTSGRVFPKNMKAAPLLRAWLHRLRAGGVHFHMRHRWVGWSPDGIPVFENPAGRVEQSCDALVLALGGASWSRLGSDGRWVALLESRGIAAAPLRPANCGFDVRDGWTPHFRERFAGQPFKSVALRFVASDGRAFERKGEFVATATGVEGSLIYAVSALLRDELQARGSATFELDLLPARPAEQVLAEVRHPRGSRSLSSHLKSRLGLDGIKLGILYEHLGRDGMADADRVAATIKALPVTVSAARPVDEAISTAGGVQFASLDSALMLRGLPGVFCAGEMLDWEAPTGGYLLTACMATGRSAGEGVARFLGLEASHGGSLK